MSSDASRTAILKTASVASAMLLLWFFGWCLGLSLPSFSVCGFVWALNLYWQRGYGKDGIGMGDAKLLGAAGAWLGPLALPFVTLVASGIALLGIVLTKVFLRRIIDASARIAFGPYIAIGFWSVWLWSPI